MDNMEYFVNRYRDYLKSEVSGVISKNDKMFWYGAMAAGAASDDAELYRGWINQYYFVGKNAAREIINACLGSYLSRVERVLDLACGHGRVARHLVKLFPYASISAADVDEGGVDFCAEQFGAEGIHLPDDLAEFDFGHQYDVVWSGSLFTHFPRNTVKRWIDHICNNCLSPYGIFIYTLYNNPDDLHTLYPIDGARAQREYQEDGYGFANNESNNPNDGGGLAVVQPYVALRDAGSIGSVRILSYRERAWNEHQDVVVLGKPASLPIPHGVGMDAPKWTCSSSTNPATSPVP